jgi:hypothetical protein
MNKYFITETLQRIFVNIVHIYHNPTRAKKKKLKEFVHAIPHLFFHDDVQNKLFSLIHDNPIDSYFDTKESLDQYFYFIYSEMCKFLDIIPSNFSEYKSSVEFQILNDTQIIRESKKKHIATLIYLFIFATIIFLYCKYL